jgi:hypothetical protein
MFAGGLSGSVGSQGTEIYLGPMGSVASPAADDRHCSPTPPKEDEVALPQLTDEQRTAALAKAAAARKSRAELKERLKRGGTTLKQVLVDAEKDEALAKLKVSALLEALPGVGKVRAAALMEQFDIAASRRVRGLGDRQRKALLDEFGF